jgi:2-polyprenyl-6-methoxyphenol hydroxylase-like FAD-dependent oxidoreductase
MSGWIRSASPYSYALMLPQSDTERLLEDRLLRLGVPVERSTEVTALRIVADGAEATLRRADGKEEVIHADWLAGCDGAHSIVRHTLAVPFSGEMLGSDWILADVHMKGYPFLDTEVAVYWAHEGVLPIFPISPGRYRIIANVPPAAKTILAIRLLKTFRRSSNSGDPRASACSIRSGCRASESIRERSQLSGRARVLDRRRGSRS